MADIANNFGTYLRDRRSRLDPTALGFPGGRRRTPGLRREEVAQRANISPTWYTWLEQGRGGAPSADVLDRIANGLMLTEPEREHLYMLGIGRPPGVRYKRIDGITPRLQRVLDALEISPAIIKTATWDVIAWNRAAAALLTDYSKLPREGRNILRLMFADPGVRVRQEDWQSVALCGGCIPRRRGARRCNRRNQQVGRGAVADQPRVRGDVARQQRGRAWRGAEAPAPLRAWLAGTGILRLRGRWTARTRHGYLPSCNR